MQTSYEQANLRLIRAASDYASAKMMLQCCDDPKLSERWKGVVEEKQSELLHSAMEYFATVISK